MSRLLYCQRCGESQVVIVELRSCPACGHLRFSVAHPAAQIKGWRWPGPTSYDRELLAEMKVRWESE